MYYPSRTPVAPAPTPAPITDAQLTSLLFDKRWRYLRFTDRPAPPVWNDDLDDFRWRCILGGIDTDIFDRSLAAIRDAAEKSWPFIVRNSREFEYQMCSRLLHVVDRFRLVAKYVVALARQASALGPWLKPLHALWHSTAPALEVPLQACVHCLSVSRSGTKVAVGAGNRVLVLYLNTMLTRTLYTHKCDVSSVAMTPDGTRVISGSAHGDVRVCDVRAAYPHALGDTVFEHYSPVTHLAVAASGRFFVSGSADCICVWNTRKATLADVPLRLSNAGVSVLRGLAISASGRTVLYSTAPLTPPAYDPVASAAHLSDPAAKKKPVRSDSGDSVGSADGSAIGSGSSLSSFGWVDDDISNFRSNYTTSGTLTSTSDFDSLPRSGGVFNVNNISAAVAQAQPPPPPPPSSASQTQQPQSHMPAASEVQRVMIFDIGAGDPPRPVHVNVTERGRGQIPRAFLGCTADGLAIVRIGIAVVQVIDLETRETVQTIRSVPNWFSSAAASAVLPAGPKGEYLFAGWSRDGDDDVAVWRVGKQDGLLSHEGFRLGLGRGLNERDRRRMANAVAFTTTAVTTPGLSTDEDATAIAAIAPTANRSTSATAASGPARPRILTGATDGTLRIWDATVSTPAKTICPGGVAAPNAAAALFTWVRVCPFGRRVATVARDGKMAVWAFDSGRRLYGNEDGPEDMVTAMAFAADGVRVVLGTNSGNLTLWDPSAETAYDVTWSHGLYVSDIRTHANDPNIILVYADDYASAWDLDAHQLRLRDSWHAPHNDVDHHTPAQFRPQHRQENQQHPHHQYFPTSPGAELDGSHQSRDQFNSEFDVDVDLDFDLLSIHDQNNATGSSVHNVSSNNIINNNNSLKNNGNNPSNNILNHRNLFRNHSYAHTQVQQQTQHPSHVPQPQAQLPPNSSPTRVQTHPPPTNSKFYCRPRSRSRSRSHNGRHSVDTVLPPDSGAANGNGDSNAASNNAGSSGIGNATGVSNVSEEADVDPTLSYGARATYAMANTRWGDAITQKTRHSQGLRKNSGLKHHGGRRLSSNGIGRRQRSALHLSQSPSSPTSLSKHDKKEVQVRGRSVVLQITHTKSTGSGRISGGSGRLGRRSSTRQSQTIHQHVLATLPAEVNGCNAWHFNEERGAFVAGLRDGTIIRCQLQI